MAIFSRGPSASRSISPFKAGLVAIVLVVIGTYFAYTQANPFADAYEFKAAFNTVNNLAPDSPVRLAGVDVGVVKEITPLEDGGDGAIVTMEVEDRALPIHEDAELKIRPRIFLEGNEFVDVLPGTPSSPELEEGETIPVNQTATPVQLGQVLSVLQSDTREDLRTFFVEYSTNALEGGGARKFRNSIKYWEDAYRNSALANEALLGTEEGDLFRVLKGQQRTFAALSEDPDALRDLIVNFNTTAAAFALEDDALQATVPALRDVLAVGRPALQSLNSSFPGVQRFAVDALPGVRSSQTTVPESFPFVRQLRLLFRPSELRGLAADLRRTIPPLSRVNTRTIPFLQQNRSLSRCTNEVLVPFSRTPIPTRRPQPGSQPVTGPESNPNVGPLVFPFAPDSSDQPFFKQAGRAFVGLSGESRAYDANNEFFRVGFKLDPAPLEFFRPSGGFLNSPSLGSDVISLTRPEEEAQPAPPPDNQDVRGSSIDEYRRPAFRPDFPCELSVPPDLRAAVYNEKIPGTSIPLSNDASLLRDLVGLPAKADISEAEQVKALAEIMSGDVELDERPAGGDPEADGASVEREQQGRGSTAPRERGGR